jgi:hypothetical protein
LLFVDQLDVLEVAVPFFLQPIQLFKEYLLVAADLLDGDFVLNVFGFETSNFKL